MVKIRTATKMIPNLVAKPGMPVKLTPSGKARLLIVGALIQEDSPSPAVEGQLGESLVLIRPTKLFRPYIDRWLVEDASGKSFEISLAWVEEIK